MKIWDTAGQERFKTITFNFYRQAQGVIIAFDVTNEKSYQNVQTWIESLDKHAAPGIAKVLVGNKVDLKEKRKITEEEAREFAGDHNMSYFETSAKENINIKETIEYIMDQVYKFKNEQEDSGRISLEPNYAHSKKTTDEKEACTC